MTKQELKDLLILNLESIKTYGAQVKVRDLIERGIDDPNISNFRVFDTTTDSHVTSLDDFKNKIDADMIMEDFHRTGNSNYGVFNGCSFTVTLGNFVVDINEHTSKDQWYAMTYGVGFRRIQFTLNYLNDADDIQPLKVQEVKLVKV